MANDRPTALGIDLVWRHGIITLRKSQLSIDQTQGCRE